MAADETTAPEVEKKGIVDGLDRIAAELLGDPKFKRSLIILLSSLDPKSASGLVKTLFWGDSSVTLSLIGAVPELLNTGIETLAEVARQVRVLPTALLVELVRQIAPRIDGYTLGEAVGRLATVGRDLAAGDGSVGEGLNDLLRSFLSGYRESAGDGEPSSRVGDWMAKVAESAGDSGSPVHAAVREVITALEENPDFVERVLKPLLSAAAGARMEAAGAGASAAGAGTTATGAGTNPEK